MKRMSIETDKYIKKAMQGEFGKKRLDNMSMSEYAAHLSSFLSDLHQSINFIQKLKNKEDAIYWERIHS